MCANYELDHLFVHETIKDWLTVEDIKASVVQIGYCQQDLTANLIFYRLSRIANEKYFQTGKPTVIMLNYDTTRSLSLYTRTAVLSGHVVFLYFEEWQPR